MYKYCNLRSLLKKSKYILIILKNKIHSIQEFKKSRIDVIKDKLVQ